MNLLGTEWWPNLNPIGDSSIGAALAVGVLILVSRAFPKTVSATAPAILLFLSCVVSNVPIILCLRGEGRRFPNADDYTADILCLAFGFGFALYNFRLCSRAFRVNAVFFTLVLGALLTARGISFTYRVGFSFGVAPSVGMIVFGVCWAPIAFLLWRRDARLERPIRGLCVRCGYDLRGSKESGRCPECGTAISEKTVFPKSG